MTVTRLGQAGLLFRTSRTAVLIDPYFSDSAFAVSGEHRRTEVPPEFRTLRPDLLLLTHDHIDHCDPETVREILLPATDPVTVLCPKSVRERLQTDLGPASKKHNLVLMTPGVVWTEKDVTATTLTARHSDPYAVGFALEAEGKRIVVTGDTLFDPDLRIPFSEPDWLFLPVNGRGNNMNGTDAAKLAETLHANKAVPVHYGMLDDLKPDVFVSPVRTVLDDYVTYEL